MCVSLLHHFALQILFLPPSGRDRFLIRSHPGCGSGPAGEKNRKKKGRKALPLQEGPRACRHPQGVGGVPPFWGNVPPREKEARKSTMKAGSRCKSTFTLCAGRAKGAENKFRVHFERCRVRPFLTGRAGLAARRVKKGMGRRAGTRRPSLVGNQDPIRSNRNTLMRRVR